MALYLLFPYEDGKLGLEAIGSKQLHRGLKLLKQKPVVPAIGDLPLSLMHILHQLSAFLVAHGEITSSLQFISDLTFCGGCAPLFWWLHVTTLGPRAVHIPGAIRQA